MIGDLIEEGCSGLLADSNTDFAAKMATLARDPAARRSLGTAALTAAQRYSIERTTAELERRYDDVLGAAGPDHT